MENISSQPNSNSLRAFFESESKMKYLLLSLLSGIAVALSFQKANIFILAWAGFIPLIYSSFRSTFKFSILLGFVTGFVCNFTALFWMFPFLKFNTGSALQALTVSSILWLYMSAYFLVWSGTVNLLRRYLNAVLTVFFSAALWVSLELCRTYLFSGFPWNLIGYTQASFTPLIQISEFAGVYGVSFLIIAANAALYFAVCEKKKKFLYFSAAVLAILFIFGFFRAGVFDKNPGEGINIGIIQPNIEQTEKWDIKRKQKIIDTLISSARQFKDKDIVFAVYPETVLPGSIYEDTAVMHFIPNVARYAQFSLIGGFDKNREGTFNSVFVISDTGEIVDIHKKTHLVLFGEYIPFRSLLSGLFSSINLFGNLSKEADIAPFEHNGITFGTLICSEIFYPYISREMALKGAGFITNHTNDAWFFTSSALPQHFVMNIFRAVENRRSIVVSANTGISGIIAPSGKVIYRTAAGTGDTFMGKVYPGNYTAVYSKAGDVFAYLCIVFSLLVLLYGAAVKMRRSNK